MANKPSTYLNWTDGAATKVTQPPAAKLLAGWVAGEKPAVQFFNWLFWLADQWIQYFDNAFALSQPGSQAASNARLIGGGTWAWNLSTQTLSWSAAAYLAYPATADANNTVPAGSLALADGAVMTVNANVPFTTTANTAAGSNQLTGLAYPLGVQVGQTVSGPNVPAGATVTAISGNTATLSQAATAATTAGTYTFEQSATLSPAATLEANVVPTATTVVLARRVGQGVIVGQGSGQMLVRDGEQKLFLDAGFLSVLYAPAGAALTAGMPVYLSPGAADGGRTAGALYPVDASSTNGAARGTMAGVAANAYAQGALACVVTDGGFSGYTGLTAGATYYASPSTPGALVTARPSGAGQYVCVVGLALSATALDLNPAAAATVAAVASTYSVDNYGVSSEAQLGAALSACQSAGGGVIALLSPFTLSASYTVPPNTVLEGSTGATVLTFLSGAALVLQTNSSLRDVFCTTALVASVTLVTLTGDYPVVRGCRFTLPTTAAASCTCVALSGSGARLYNNAFVNVAGGAASGLAYLSGSDNQDDSSVFV